MRPSCSNWRALTDDMDAKQNSMSIPTRSVHSFSLVSMFSITINPVLLTRQIVCIEIKRHGVPEWT